MRAKAFGQEPPGSLLDSAEVAQRSIDLLISGQTGLILDIRKDDPL
jgi:2-C-methyl-D-erythritol 4-phosphate cytidylyltransferase